MKGIDIVIPVHKYDDNVKALLTRCLESLKGTAEVANAEGIETNVLVVGKSLSSDEIMNLVDWKDVFKNFNVVDNNSDDTDFCSQVNLAVKECKNDYSEENDAANFGNYCGDAEQAREVEHLVNAEYRKQSKKYSNKALARDHTRAEEDTVVNNCCFLFLALKLNLVH